MANLVRRNATGPGAEVLVNQGKKWLRYVDGLPRFFDNDIMDKAYRNILANRIHMYPDGSTLMTRRGGVVPDRVAANMPVFSPLVADGKIKFFVALDAWSVSSGDGTDAGLLISPVEDLLNWTLIPASSAIAAEIPYLPAFCDTSPNIFYSSLGVRNLFEVFPQNRATLRNPILRTVTPYYWWTDYAGENTWNEKKSPQLVVSGPGVQSYSVWSALVGGTELISSYRYYWDYSVTVDPNPPGSGSESVSGVLRYENYYSLTNGVFIPEGYANANQYGLLASKANGDYSFSAYYSGSGGRPSDGFMYGEPTATSGKLGWTAEPIDNRWDFLSRFNDIDIVIDSGVSGQEFVGNGVFSLPAKFYKNDLVDQWYSLFIRFDEVLNHICLGVVGANAAISHRHLSTGAAEWFSCSLGYVPGFTIESDKGIFYTTGRQPRLLFSALPSTKFGMFNKVLKL